MIALANSSNGASSVSATSQSNASPFSTDLLRAIRELEKLSLDDPALSIDCRMRVPEFSPLGMAISAEQYSSLTCHILQPPAVPFVCSRLIQHMTDSDCSPTTRYLAKIYMDLYIKAHPNEGFQTYKEVAFISMYMAVKFNENFVYSASQQKLGLSQQHIAMVEMNILAVLKYRLRQRTPLCFLEILKGVFKNYGPSDFEDIESMIELAAVDFRLINYSSSEIFLSSLICYTKLHLQEKDIPLLKQTIEFSPNLPRIVQILEQTVNEPDDQEQ